MRALRDRRAGIGGVNCTRERLGPHARGVDRDPFGDGERSRLRRRARARARALAASTSSARSVAPGRFNVLARTGAPEVVVLHAPRHGAAVVRSEQRSRARARPRRVRREGAGARDARSRPSALLAERRDAPRVSCSPSARRPTAPAPRSRTRSSPSPGGRASPIVGEPTGEPLRARAQGRVQGEARRARRRGPQLAADRPLGRARARALRSTRSLARRLGRARAPRLRQLNVGTIHGGVAAERRRRARRGRACSCARSSRSSRSSARRARTSSPHVASSRRPRATARSSSRCPRARKGSRSRSAPTRRTSALGKAAALRPGLDPRRAHRSREAVASARSRKPSRRTGARRASSSRDRRRSDDGRADATDDRPGERAHARYATGGEALLDALETGEVRVAERARRGRWIVNAWVKEEILRSSGARPSSRSATSARASCWPFRDKAPLGVRRFAPRTACAWCPAARPCAAARTSGAASCDAAGVRQRRRVRRRGIDGRQPRARRLVRADRRARAPLGRARRSAACSSPSARGR